MAENRKEKTETGEALNTEEVQLESGTAEEQPEPAEAVKEPETGGVAEEESAEAAEAETAEKSEEKGNPVEKSEEKGNPVEKPEEEENPTEEPEAGKSGKETEPDGTRKGKKKSFFKKEKKDKKDEKIEELTDRLQRQMAEFDNFRKRTEKEKASMYQIGAKDVIEKILPVIDNFERGLETGDASDPFVDGMNKIYKQMVTMLTELGVTPIEAVGKPFDPNLHNAVMHVEDENAGENEVVEEFQKGYLYKDAVVRYSMVKVAN